MIAPKPRWLKVRFPSDEAYFSVSSLLERLGLETICRNARCPNIGECWSERTATFLILGKTCTRSCAFCAVAKGDPGPLDDNEPVRVAEAAAALGLRYAVVTSVTRDDLPDGGAGHFAATIEALRAKIPGVRVEALIPDFQGEEAPLKRVLEAKPDVLNHNLETTESMYPRIRRPAAYYRRSLEVLAGAARMGAVTKSGLMVGLGESEADLDRTLEDLRAAAVRYLTIGQYLQPTRDHVPVGRFVPPDEFDRLRNRALALGFAGVEAGPLVRSSYRAARLAAATPRPPEEQPCAT